MIILDEDETSQTQSSERSPLKSPVSPVTAARYDASTPNALPPYITTGSSSAQSSHWQSHAHYQHQHHTIPSPNSPHPHSPHPHESHHHHHHRHNSFGASYTGSVHSTTNLPPHIVKMIEERELRHRTRHRFISSLAVALFIILVWYTLIGGISAIVLHHQSMNNNQDINVSSGDPPPLIRWPHVHFSAVLEIFRVQYPNDTTVQSAPGTSVVIPTSSGAVVTATGPGLDRILSISYPPSPSLG
ncbi:hypothetical protein NP233_g9581 [Leucocoprinus birnbaumii]|uniref:Transmembrane protein n=1 Tax=Leucocoprinus birnbaumii TaxID=56174 RepID=A0AAD5YSQ8_9AGAR|nr:hypothetical protein NP233_g9581 [Leucocoprinus birnbaumii]